jgi:hypothetical protein
MCFGISRVLVGIVSVTLTAFDLFVCECLTLYVFVHVCVLIGLRRDW